MPLIEGVLIAGDTLSTIRIRWLHASGAAPTAPDPGSVSFELTGPSGTRAPLIADPDSSALFIARLPIAAGGSYRLSGTIGSESVSAETTVPTSFLIAEPAGDTVTQPAAAVTAQVPFRWALEGATVVVADSALFPPGYSSSRSLEGILFVARRPSGTTGPTIRFWAMNQDAERYLLGGPAPATNVDGGFGGLGAAALRHRVVRWQ